MRYLPAKYRINTNTKLDSLIEELEKPNNFTFIYFFQASNGLIKIGTSKDPKRRLNDIRRSSPLSVKNLCCINGTYKKELILHKVFRKFRSHGEWFYPNPLLLKLIEFLIP